LNHQEVEQGQVPTSTASTSIQTTCKQCGKNSHTGIIYDTSGASFCSLNCLYTCEKCGNSSVYHKDGKTIVYCLINNQKLCSSCAEEVINNLNHSSFSFIYCSKCGRSGKKMRISSQNTLFCPECADQEYSKCEECNNSSIHYTDGKKIDHCSIDGKKLCFSCFEIRVKEKYNSPSTNDEQETSPTFSIPNYSADNYHPSPKVKFDQHDQHQEKEPQTTQQRSPSISNSELDLHKKILQKEIENLLENNPQIKLEEN